MAVFSGIWNFAGRPVDQRVIHAANAALPSFAPDGDNLFSNGGFALTYHAFHTTTESHREKQPYVSISGAVIAWDGRLDNREELIQELGHGITSHSADVEIVAASFDRWDTKCFERLIGDWAVSIWSEKRRLLLLAKDFVGIRPLYYMLGKDHVQWSSVLDPLVTLSGTQFPLNLAYVAGWLGIYPAADSSPFVGIDAVPPSSFVALEPQKCTVVKYWDFEPSKRISYRSDGEYEEHFRSLFRQAVRRRLRADRPICAELSGGMDSPSITCMAHLIASSSSSVPAIHTLSFYDETEPHGDERPYFLKVEEAIGSKGYHVDLAGTELFRFEDNRDFMAMPGCLAGRPQHLGSMYLESRGVRVVLSGIGGDEMMGGVPSPVPELQDLIVQRKLRHLAHKLKLWALSKRKPWFHLLAEAMKGFFPIALAGQPKYLRPAPWLRSEFVRQYREVLSGFNERVRFIGQLPSMQANLGALDVVRRQLATSSLPTKPPHEKRYPFLDRTLLEFIFAIPREQLLLPGYRRSLMRRALKGIVPTEILERRRKAYASRGLRVAISTEWNRLSILCENMAADRAGVLNEARFRDALVTFKDNDQIPSAAVARTILLEAWLRHLDAHAVLTGAEMKRVEQRGVQVNERVTAF